MNRMLAASAARGNHLGRTLCSVLLLLGMAVPVAAQTLTLVHSFSGPDGSTPCAGILLASDGNFYGTTVDGGANGFGTIYAINSQGILNTVYSFAETDGSYPMSALIQGSDGALYGTTNAGGAHNLGTIYRITAAGALTTLYSFSGPDGNNPYGSLLQGPDGNFYGTTAGGGAGASGNLGGFGTVFQLTLAGKLTLLHSFQGQPGGDGGFPFSNVVYLGNGYFAGATARGGTADNFGVVYFVNVAGDITEPVLFDGSNGDGGFGGLILGTDGNEYGVTMGDGEYGFGTLYRVTPAGEESVLSNFGAGGQPYNAFGNLVQASDGNFYGASNSNSNYGYGSLFEFNPATASLLTFDFAGSNGSAPYSTLIEASGGSLWGTTSAGGAHGMGEVFKFTLPTLDHGPVTRPPMDRYKPLVTAVR